MSTMLRSINKAKGLRFDNTDDVKKKNQLRACQPLMNISINIYWTTESPVGHISQV